MDKINNLLKKLPRNIILSLTLVVILQFFTVGCGLGNFFQDYISIKEDNATLKADLEGGRAVAEQIKALDKREEELKRREKILNERENEIEAKTIDTILTSTETGKKEGIAEQIKKDYQDTKWTLKIISILLFVLGLPFFIASLVYIFFLRDQIKKLEYAKISAEKTIDTLRSKFNNSSVSVEEIKTVVETYTQLSNPTSSVLPPAIQSGILPPSK
jgi:cell division protein FtsB